MSLVFPPGPIAQTRPVISSGATRSPPKEPNDNGATAIPPSTLGACEAIDEIDRKSTRLNSSHQIISYAVFCLKKKKKSKLIKNHNNSQVAFRPSNELIISKEKPDPEPPAVTAKSYPFLPTPPTLSTLITADNL